MDSRDWDNRYRERTGGPPGPARVLEENAHLLPTRGRALDLACGLGGNACFLARAGLDVDAWDFSPIAVERLQAFAGSEGLAVHTAVRDILAEPPPAAGYDVIVVARFLERSLAPSIAAGLRPGGLLFYQTFTRTAVGDAGPKNPAFRLARNELVDLFAALRLVAYREEDRLGDTSRGFRDEAYLVAQKPWH